MNRDLRVVRGNRAGTRADAEKADTIVVLHGATERKTRLDTFYSGGGYGGYRWRGGMGVGHMECLMCHTDHTK